MSKMRHIDGEIWRDEWFAEQAITGRLLWMGVITLAADDQGRLADNAALVRSDVFPMDRIEIDEIELWLTKFCQDGKLLRYEVGGKKLLQIANWWKYQASSSWMAPSKYPAPEGWTDFYHWQPKGGKKGTVETSASWSSRGLPRDTSGRYLTDHLVDGLSDHKDKDKENDNANDKDKKEQEGAAPQNPPPPTPRKTPAAAAVNQYFTNAAEGQAHKLLLQASGLAAIPNDEVSRIDGVVALITAFGQEKCLEALVEARKNWVRTPKKTGGGTYSVTNFAWIDWASEYLATGVKRWEENKKTPVPKRTGATQAKGFDRTKEVLENYLKQGQEA